MLDLLTNAPTEVILNGRPFRVAALRFRELGVLQRWIRDHGLRPAAAVEDAVPHHPPEEHRALYMGAAKAEGEWPPTIGTEAGNRVLLASVGGLRTFMGLMLRPEQPEMTEADLDAVMDAATEDDFATLVSVAFTGLLPEPAVPGTPDPQPRRGRAPGPDYGKLFQDLITHPPYWKHQDIGELTIPQVAFMANDGRPPNRRRIEFRSPAEAVAHVDRAEPRIANGK